MKTGWQTTEFWVTVLTSAWAIFGHALPPVAQAVVTGVATVAYSISRGIAKTNPMAIEPPPIHQVGPGRPPTGMIP